MDRTQERVDHILTKVAELKSTRDASESLVEELAKRNDSLPDYAKNAIATFEKLKSKSKSFESNNGAELPSIIQLVQGMPDTMYKGLPSALRAIFSKYRE